MSNITSLVNSSDVFMGPNEDHTPVCMYFKWKIHQVYQHQYVIAVQYHLLYVSDETRYWNYTFLVPTTTAENSEVFLSNFARNVIFDNEIFNRTCLWKTILKLSYESFSKKHKEEYQKKLKNEDIIILEDTSLSNSSSYFEYEILIGNSKYERYNYLYESFEGSISEFNIYIKICYKYKKISSNQFALLASFYFRGSNSPNYIWTFLFIYTDESLDKIQFFKDFANHVLLTDSTYVDLGLYYKMHFQNSIEQEEFDDGRDYDQNRFLKFLKDNNVIIIENHHLRISEHDEDMKPPYQPDMQGSINIDKFLFKQDATTCQVYYFNFS